MGSIFVISSALALGTYGIAAHRGANLVKLDRYTVIMSAIWGSLELAFALTGCAAGRWILTGRIAADQNRFWIHILAGVLMAAVGLRMLLQAFQKKTLLEHRMETVDIKADTVLSLRLCDLCGNRICERESKRGALYRPGDRDRRRTSVHIGDRFADRMSNKIRT